LLYLESTTKGSDSRNNLGLGRRLAASSDDTVLGRGLDYFLIGTCRYGLSVPDVWYNRQRELPVLAKPFVACSPYLDCCVLLRDSKHTDARIVGSGAGSVVCRSAGDARLGASWDVGPRLGRDDGSEGDGS
jgi:hypothetical protein